MPIPTPSAEHDDASRGRTGSVDEKPTSHTPGPWKVLAGTVIVDADEGYFLGSVPENFKRSHDPDGFRETRANARLIASAPKLLSLLQRIHAAVDFHRGAGKEEEDKTTARELLIETVEMFDSLGWLKAEGK